MVSLKYLYLGASLVSSTLASSCWRNATCTHPTEASFPGPWDANIYAPDSRTARPKSVLSLATGDAIGSFPCAQALKGNGSALVFDFGVLVGGITTVNYTYTGDGPATLGLAWTEAKNWIGEYSDNSNGNYRGPNATLISVDGALFHNITARGEGSYTVPFAQLRGGFRYLTIYLITNSSSSTSATNTSVPTVAIDDVSVEIVFQPTWSNLRAYQGYFHSSSDLLNKIWYAGAYTLQTNAAPPETGRVLTEAVWNGSWFNDAYLGVGSSLLLDGAKRDRWIWPGDMGVAVPSAFVSTGDLESARNALQTMFDYQQPSGIFPRAGPPYLDASSDTYHMWTMIGAYNYVLFSGDTDWLARNWAAYLRAMDYIYAKIIPATGILNATATGDWARYIYSTNGSAPNMLLYRTLTTGAFLADLAPSNSSSSSSSSANLTSTWLARSETLKTAIKTHLWDPTKGAFFDGPKNRTLYPQDANAYALAFGLLDPSSPDAASVSQTLTENWTPIGPASPELPGNVSPFITSIELEAHFAAGRADRALRLIRDSWGWYLAHPNGTQSTVIEGYLADGTFGYRSTRGYTHDPSYVSHAHGWSSGPTSTLTEYLVGLRVTAPAGREWRLKPVFGEVEAAQAGFTTALGRFSARWEVRNGSVASVEWDVPAGTRGWVEFGAGGGGGRWVEGGTGREVVDVVISKR